MNKIFDIKRHLANPKMIRISGLQIRPVPECEGGGYFLLGQTAEDIVSVILAYQNRNLLNALDYISQPPTQEKKDDH